MKVHLRSGTKVFLACDLLFLLFVAVSCNQQSEERRKKAVDDFQTFVRARIDSVDYYVGKSWDSLQADFDRQKAKVDKDTGQLAEDSRDTYYETLRDWETFKSEYGIKKDEKQKLDQMDKLRKSLTISGVRTDYTDLMATNIVSEYEHFVDAVRANKDNFTREQWTVINVSWKGLNGRKREIEKDIPADENSKIIKLQLQYTGIKASNRPLAENE